MERGVLRVPCALIKYDLHGLRVYANNAVVKKIMNVSPE
jgi:hypothetical protein